VVAKAVEAFDQANRASGVDLDVTTLMMTDFGRTLRPAPAPVPITPGATTGSCWAVPWQAGR
jgi:hypothetical protein